MRICLSPELPELLHMYHVYQQQHISSIRVLQSIQICLWFIIDLNYSWCMIEPVTEKQWDFHKNDIHRLEQHITIQLRYML